MTCKYFDSGWCYAPEDVEHNSKNGSCIEPLSCPYRKSQMTFNNDIEKTEAEIKVLQKKLELLKEIEAHKSQPRMEFDFGGKFEVVFYNGENYSRHEFDDGSHNWYKRKFTDEGVVMMVAITDGETRRLLEGLWFNEVKGGKYD